jgi:hypothetical protein
MTSNYRPGFKVVAMNLTQTNLSASVKSEVDIMPCFWSVTKNPNKTRDTAFSSDFVQIIHNTPSVPSAC